MILDTSVVVAILNDEPSRPKLEAIIAVADSKLSSVSYLEASIVLMNRRGEEALASLDAWQEAANIEITPFTAAQARIARNAYARFGKGRHPVALNFADCASYGLAIDEGGEL